MTYLHTIKRRHMQRFLACTYHILPAFRKACGTLSRVKKSHNKLLSKASHLAMNHNNLPVCSTWSHTRYRRPHSTSGRAHSRLGMAHSRSQRAHSRPPECPSGPTPGSGEPYGTPVGQSGSTLGLRTPLGPPVGLL